MTIYDVILELRRINSTLERKLTVAKVSENVGLSVDLTLATAALNKAVEHLRGITEIVDRSLNYDREIL